MDTQAKLIEIIKNSELEDEVKATVISLINEGPVTKSILNDILNLLEAKAMEQDTIEKVETHKAEIYEELSAKLQEIADEEVEAGTKNIEQLADDLESVAQETKEHIAGQGAAPAASEAQTVTVETTTTTAPTVPTL